MTKGIKLKANPVLTLENIQKSKGLVNEIYVDDKVEDYIVNIIYSTRQP